MWSKKHCDNHSNMDLKEIIGNFLEYIHFHKIPANILMKEIHPLGLVPYHIIMNALAYQVSRAWFLWTKIHTLYIIKLLPCILLSFKEISSQ